MREERRTRLRERAGEAKKSLVREVGGLLDMSTTPMAIKRGACVILREMTE